MNEKIRERFDSQIAKIQARMERDQVETAFSRESRAAVEAATVDMTESELRDLLAATLRLVRPL
jgi:hypothetical protein